MPLKILYAKWYEQESHSELAHHYDDEISQALISKTIKGVEGENPATQKSCTECMRVHKYMNLLQEQAASCIKDKCKVYSTCATINGHVREVSKLVLLTYGNSYLVTTHCNRLAQVEKFLSCRQCNCVKS